MTTAVKRSNENKYGPNGKCVSDLLTRLYDIEWYTGFEKETKEVADPIQTFTKALGINNYEISGLKKKQFPEFVEGMRIETSPLWETLKSIPNEMKKTAKETDRTELITFAMDDVPEMVFHGAYEGAYREFNEVGGYSLQTAVGAAMYISALACAWEILADLKEWKENPFLALIDIFEKGRLPLGLYDSTFYVL